MAKRNIWKYYSIGGTVLIFAAILAGVAAVSLDRLAIMITRPNEQVTTASTVCSGDIDEYNKLMTTPDSGKDLIAFVDRITSKPNSDSDASCLFMRVQGNAFIGNLEEAKQALSLLKGKTDDNLYPSTKIDTLTSLRSLEIITAGFKSPDSNGDG